MSNKKKLVRQAFRDACYKRDGYKCAMCGFKSTAEKAKEELDAHHINDRNLMPNGGYVAQNGISLCASCHMKAEEFWSTGTAHPGYSQDDLYKKIGSNLEKATKASEKL